MLARGEDNATMRFALGSAYLKAGDSDKAVGHLSVAVDLDPEYSAAWKLLGKAQTEAGLPAAAIETYRRGIEVAPTGGKRAGGGQKKVPQCGKNCP